MEDEPRRLSLGRAALWVLGGGLAAQLAGGFTSGIVQGFLRARGMSDPELDQSALVIVPAMLVSMGGLMAVAVLAPLTAGQRLPEALGLRRAPAICFAAAAVGTIALGPFADHLMRAAHELLPPDFRMGVVPALNQLVRTLPVYVSFLVFALLPGLSEELLFRGVLQRAAGSGTPAILVSALAFSLFHVDPEHVAGVLPLGFFLAWVATRCGTLVTVVAHVANNTAAVASLHSPTFDVGYGSDTPMPASWLPISLGAAALCAWLIARASPRASEPGSF